MGQQWLSTDTPEVQIRNFSVCALQWATTERLKFGKKPGATPASKFLHLKVNINSKPGLPSSSEISIYREFIAIKLSICESFTTVLRREARGRRQTGKAQSDGKTATPGLSFFRNRR
jgi:hypothetical protein